MIVVFCGKRNSGKTTLCKAFHTWIKSNANMKLKCHYLDSDKLKYIFDIKGVNKINEKKLLNISVDLARYESYLNHIVLLAMSFAYEEERKRLSGLKDVLWIYLDGEGRETIKEEYESFEEPNLECINTHQLSENECLEIVITKYKNFCLTSQK